VSVCFLIRLLPCPHFLLTRGDVALLFNDNLSRPDSNWVVDKIWMQGHVGVVRSLLMDEQVSTLGYFA
jgi:hypothetical protein